MNDETFVDAWDVASPEARERLLWTLSFLALELPGEKDPVAIEVERLLGLLADELGAL